MHVLGETTRRWRFGAPPAALLRGGCAAALIVLAACGGGGGDAGPAPAVPDAAPAAAVSIGVDTAEDPVDVRVAQGAQGDAFVVWRANDGTRHNLWASRYSAATGAWSDAVRIEASDDDIGGDFDVWVDAEGNAAALWIEAITGYVSARYEVAKGTWGAATSPTLTEFQGTGTEVAFNPAQDATGVQRGGSYFDPVHGTRSGVLIESREGSGSIEGGPVAVDGRGRAIGIYAPTRVGAGFLIGNYFSASLGGWERLPEEETLLDGIPGSSVCCGAYNNDVQLTRSLGDDFLAAWQVIDDGGMPGAIHVAHFTPAGRTWSGGGPTVAATPGLDLRFQRLKSSGEGETRLLTWTQNEGARTALKALRLFREGAACEAVRTLDDAVGGGAARADLAVDPSGHAIAVWQQFEGGRIDDGSRSNIAFSRFDARTATWRPAAFAEAEPGNAEAPRVSANAGQALLAWIQAEGAVRRVKVMLQPLGEGPAP